MHLFNLASFAVRFGIDMSVSDFSDAVTEASKAATSAVASRFRFQDFEQYPARRDIFRCDRMFGQGNSQHRQFNLARGFIDGVTGFSIYATDSIIHVRNGDTNQLTNLQDSAQDGQSNYVVIDAEQGLVTVHSQDLTDMWVVINYTCGLPVATDDQYEQVPAWLKDAGEAQALLLLKYNRAFKTDDGVDEMRPISDSLDRLWGAHARIYPSALKPTSSEPGK